MFCPLARADPRRLSDSGSIRNSLQTNDRPGITCRRIIPGSPVLLVSVREITIQRLSSVSSFGARAESAQVRRHGLSLPQGPPSPPRSPKPPHTPPPPPTNPPLGLHSPPPPLPWELKQTNTTPPPSLLLVLLLSFSTTSCTPHPALPRQPLLSPAPLRSPEPRTM